MKMLREFDRLFEAKCSTIIQREALRALSE